MHSGSGLFRVVFVGLLLAAGSGSAQLFSDDLDKAFAELSRYSSGDDTAFIKLIDQRVGRARHVAGLAAALEDRFLELLKAQRVSSEAKDLVARQLFRICSEDALEALEELLVRPDTSRFAGYVLGGIEGQKTQDFLLRYLGKVRGPGKVNVIRTLGVRGDESAVRALRNLSGDGDPEIMRASIEAFGEIGGAAAASAALWCMRNVRSDLRPVAGRAYLKCASGFLRDGERDRAIDMYDEVFLDTGLPQVRREALDAMIRAEGEDGAYTIIEVLSNLDRSVFDAALAVVPDVPSERATVAMAEAVRKLKPDAQALLLEALARRGDAAALPAVLRAITHVDAQVRLSALKALGSIGDASTVLVLLKAAVASDDVAGDAARESIVRLKASGTDHELVKIVLGANNLRRSAAISLLAERHAENTVPLMFRVIEREAEPLRVAALEALGVLALQSDLADLIVVLSKASSPRTRLAAEASVARTISRLPLREDRVTIIRDLVGRRLNTSGNQRSLVRVLALLGEDSGLSSLTAVARRGEREAQDLAIEVLSNWPNAKPVDEFAKLLVDLEPESQRKAVFTGFLRLLGLPSERGLEQTLDYYRLAVEMGYRLEEKRMVLDGLSRIHDRAALEVVALYDSDDEVQPDATVARNTILRALE